MNHNLATSRRAFVAAASLVVANIVTLAHPAAEAANTTTSPVAVSDTNPLQAGSSYCPLVPGFVGVTPPEDRDWENDNELGVDPARPGHLVTAWIQDYQDAIVVGYSTNGGQSWKRSLPKTSTCSWLRNGQEPPTGPDIDFSLTGSSNDPAVAIGPSADPDAPAITYVTSIVAAAEFSQSATIANTSPDGGRTWSDPVVLDTAESPVGLDQTDVIADPNNPGHAYAVWLKVDLGQATGNLYFARTTNGGAEWSDPVRVTPNLPGATALEGQLSLQPNGDLVAVYDEFPTAQGLTDGNTTGPTTVLAARSTDDGQTWSAPTLVAVADEERATMPRVATAPDGTIYVAWQQVGEGGTSFSLTYSASHDGGKTWSAPKAIGPAIPGLPSEGSNNILAEPALSALADGTVGIAFYGHRDNDITNLTPSRTDYRLRTMDASGVYQGERHLAGPFDRSTAPDFKGRRSSDPHFTGGFLGDRQGMVPVESGFALTFVLASPLPDANFTLSHEPSNGNAATDVYFIQAPSTHS